MLRQDPLECLFQFVCSSNNHISRIHGMVDRLCTAYGTQLHPTASAAVSHPFKCDAEMAEPLTYFAFPSLEQLTAASEEELRAAGFGYRYFLPPPNNVNDSIWLWLNIIYIYIHRS